MSNNNLSEVTREILDCFLNFTFTSTIQRTSCLVEQQYKRVLDQRSSNSYSLFLSTRELTAYWGKKQNNVSFTRSRKKEGSVFVPPEPT
mmetsp:Transcript_40923/g.47058  ORF Transcript_40923/g.47058 Transcript_40923/m.47058 type:complete len:89 (-) Transcript_40923:1686-1952(-)